MSTPLSARSLLTLLGLCLVLLASACSSSGGPSAGTGRAKSGNPLRLRYLAYASGQRLELVNDSHTDRTEMYSSTKKLDEAFVKVATDEVLDETLANFEHNGYFEHAQPGSAPLAPEAGISQALEVEKDGRTTFWAIQKTASDADRKRFLECAQLFAFVYNNTYQLQAVERAPDWESQNAAVKKRRTP